MNTVKLSAAVSVNKGKVRNNNEDNFYFNGEYLLEQNRDIPNTLTSVSSHEIEIYGVFDGMGGEALGEDASYIAAYTLKETHQKLLTSNHTNREKNILSAIKDANKRICKKIVESGEKRIGTTFSALKIENDTAKIYNIGDSRVYLFRSGQLIQISEDDTAAQRLVNLGIITKDDARIHKDKHKLTQHLGIFPNEMIIEPHISREFELKKGDKFLLCSDGLTDMVDDSAIKKILSQSKNSDDLSRELVYRALHNGGKDNITVMVISVDTNPRKNNLFAIKKKIVMSFIVIVLCIMVGLVLKIQLNSDTKDTINISDAVDTAIPNNIYFSNAPDEILVGTDNYFIIANSNGDVCITSSDSNIIEIIDETDGHYRAVSEGNVTITATLGDYKVSKDIRVYRESKNLRRETE